MLEKEKVFEEIAHDWILGVEVLDEFGVKVVDPENHEKAESQVVNENRGRAVFQKNVPVVYFVPDFVGVQIQAQRHFHKKFSLQPERENKLQISHQQAKHVHAIEPKTQSKNAANRQKHKKA